MAIYLDDQPVQLEGADLGTVLEAARRRVEPQGRVVVEVRLDGAEVVGDELDRQRAAPVAAADLRLYTAAPRELAAATLEQLGPRLADARAAQSEAAELFQQDRAGEAMRRVGDAIEAWRQTQQAALQSAMLLGIDLERRTFEGQPIQAFTQELLERIRALRDAISAGDTVTLADALAYEWPELTDRWERLIQELLETVRSEARE